MSADLPDAMPCLAWIGRSILVGGHRVRSVCGRCGWSDRAHGYLASPSPREEER